MRRRAESGEPQQARTYREYACDYFTSDVGDLRLELGSEILRMTET